MSDIMRLEIDAPLKANERERVKQLTKSKEAIQRFITLADAYEKADALTQINVLEMLGIIRRIELRSTSIRSTIAIPGKLGENKVSKAGNEHSLRKKVSEWLTSEMKAQRLWYIKINPGRFMRPGVPDYLICVSGRFLGVELKHDSNEPSPRQLLEGRLIENASGMYVNCRSLMEIQQAVEKCRRSIV